MCKKLNRKDFFKVLTTSKVVAVFPVPGIPEMYRLEEQWPF
jgi:hypothetical protein